jgi:hypothetical protein
MVKYIRNNYPLQNELVFYCSANSYAQVVIACACKNLKRKVSIFISKTTILHKFTKQAKRIGGRYVQYVYCLNEKDKAAGLSGILLT